MTIWILTLFPQTFDGVFNQSIIKRAREKKLLKINIINIRDFSRDKHRRVDDRPYGGGFGMVMRAEPIVRAIDSIKPKPYTILLSASGHKYSQDYAYKLSKLPNIALICGHYEGVDARVEKFADDVIAIGDFVLSGGEIAGMAIVDSVMRLIPGVIKEGSIKNESFGRRNLLEAPHYTTPQNFRGLKVPDVLLSGDHAKIEGWRHKQAAARTKKMRPDILKRGK